jgi:hypothetical protein
MNTNKALILKFNNLIRELSGNPAQDYYTKVLKHYESIKDSDVEEFLKSLHSSAKIKDMHGLNRAQCDAWDEMWIEVDRMLSDKKI